jgi:hypothetical protein
MQNLLQLVDKWKIKCVEGSDSRLQFTLELSSAKKENTLPLPNRNASNYKLP